MIKTWSVFVRTNANGNQQDDTNVVAQHHRTYAGVVRGDSLERATVNAVQKTGKPAPFLLIYEGEVTVGENAAHCPCCGENLMDFPEGPSTRKIELPERLFHLLTESSSATASYKCPHCSGIFKGHVETVTRTMLFQAPGD